MPETPVRFSRQVLPLLRERCWSCHSGPHPAGGYSLETREQMLQGGRHGAAILPGRGAQSALTKYLSGELQPRMPPGGAIDREKIGLLRRWIQEGARVDTMTMPTPSTGARLATSLPKTVAPLGTGLPAPVTGIALSPDGKLLAAAGYRAVRLLDAATGQPVRTLSGAVGQVQAVTWSSDGRAVAAGGGAPGESGEIVLFDAGNGKILRTLTGHAEVVYAVAWKPGATELASGSLDKTVRIWDTATGRPRQTIKDHADGVYGVAYSPDGKLLATASADRSVKLFDTGSWKRVASLIAHQEPVTRVAFNKTGTLLASAGADRSVKIWQVKIGAMGNPVRAQGDSDTVNDCVFSPDGSLLVWGGSNRSVRVFNGEGAQQKREIKDLSDWIYSVAVTLDNRTLVAGTQDGKALFWELQTGKLLRTVYLGPETVRVETAVAGPEAAGK